MGHKLRNLDRHVYCTSIDAGENVSMHIHSRVFWSWHQSVALYELKNDYLLSIHSLHALID